MLIEQTTGQDNHEESLTISGLPYAIFPPDPEAEELREAPGLNARQESDHLTATFGCLAMMQMAGEG